MPIDRVFEKDFNARFLPLKKKIKVLEDRMYVAMIDSFSNAKLSSAYWVSQKKKLDALYIELNAIFGTWAEKELPARYRRSLKLVNARIKSLENVTATAQKTLVDLSRTNYSVQLMRALYDDAMQSMVAASTAGKANIQRLFLQTQQTLVQESLVNAAVTQGFVMGDLREAKRMLSNVFSSRAMQSVDGKQFVQAGRYRYKPSYYAELVARTKFHQAHSSAALVQAKNYDTDLVEISSHNTTTAICMPYEGKIFSVGGRDPRFPPLDDEPPFHPNCLHLMFPTFEEAMEVEGTLKSYSAFSKGDIETHPTVRSFVPISQRGAA